MTLEDLIAEIKQKLVERGTNPYRAAVEAGMPGTAIRMVLDGHQPKFERMVEICKALDLEFYVGPPRPVENLTLLENLSESGLSADQLRNLESSAQMLNRVVVESGGDPIPDDLREALLRPDEVAEPRPGYEAAGIEGAAVDADGHLVPLHLLKATRDVAVIDEVSAAAGDGAEVLDETPTGYVAFQREWLDRHNLDVSQCSLIRARGDSMEPTLPSGSRILVNRAARDRVDNRVYVMRTEDGLVVKRLRKSAGRWRIISDNPEVADRPMTRADEIIGEVAWVAWTMR